MAAGDVIAGDAAASILVTCAEHIFFAADEIDISVLDATGDVYDGEL